LAFESPIEKGEMRFGSERERDEEELWWVMAKEGPIVDEPYA